MYDERNFVRDMAREDTDQTVSAEYKIININNQSEKTEETINTQDVTTFALAEDTCKEEAEENHLLNGENQGRNLDAQNWVNFLNIENTQNQHNQQNQHNTENQQNSSQNQQNFQNHQNSENTIQFIPSFTSPSPPHFEHPPTFGSNFSAPLSPKLVPVAQRIANIERTSDNNLRSFPEISITEINVTAITGDTLNESEELIFIDRSESSTAWL